MTALSALEGRRLLDVGCGNGSYTTAMAAGFDEAWGIEVEPIRLEEFKRAIADQPEGRFSLRQMSAETLEFPDNYFDVVTAIETIEHIENLDRAVTEIYRVLEPGGVFLITAPNRWFPIETHSFRIGGREVSSKHWPLVPWIKPLHRRISTARNFRPDDLEELLLPAGFERVGVSFLMPQFERVTSIQWLRPTVNRLEDTWWETSACLSSRLIVDRRRPRTRLDLGRTRCLVERRAVASGGEAGQRARVDRQLGVTRRGRVVPLHDRLDVRVSGNARGHPAYQSAEAEESLGRQQCRTPAA